jgi:hypothetical protein
VPVCATVGEVTVRVGDVAPEIGVNVTPSGEDSHCTSGAGVPVAAAVNVVVVPAVTERSTGWVVTIELTTMLTAVKVFAEKP